MSKLNEIVEYLDSELRVSEVKDYPGAMNGLQMENDGNISRIVSAVDASLAVIEEAARVPNSLLLVHHGMFWQGAQPFTGAFFRKINVAMKANLAIYSSHLPLDMHPVIGNNVLLAEAIGLKSITPILVKDGWATGVVGEWGASRDDLTNAVVKAVGRNVHLCPGGVNQISSVAVITGGAGSEVAKIAGLGLDAFVTGEGAHWSFIESEERGLNTFYAGHYATETFGVKRLGLDLGYKFGLESVFLEREGGL
jgi:dinuclear metal center YbgI/SA1388 family protein